MKLISCHIENFGCLSDYDIQFQNGITEIEEENGWGKSTLATFIRVMFYGFDNETRRSVTERERNQKSPWQKGTYGGTLTFQVNDRIYRMERIFDDKKAADDSFQLFDAVTNLESHDFTSHIGEELFDIDSESFRKTVFIAQQDCMSSSTDQINAKIGNLSNDTADMGNYERALEDIKNEMNRITEKRATGRGRQLKEQIGFLETKIAEKDYLEKQSKSEKENLNEQMCALHSLEEQIKETDVLIQDAARKNKAVTDARLYGQLKEELKKRAQKLSIEQDRFPAEIPSQQEVDAQVMNARNFENEKAKMNSYELSSVDQYSLQQFDKVFAQGVPDEEQISVISANVAQFELAKKAKIESALSENEMNQLQSYTKQFKETDVTDEYIENMIRLWNRSEEERLLSTGQNTNKTESTKKYVLVIGVLAVVTGVVFVFMQEVISGAALFATGAMAIIYAFMHTAKQEENRKENWKQDQEHIISFLKKNGIETGSEGVLRSLIELKGQYDKWQSLQLRYTKYMQEMNNEEQVKREKRLKNFFFPYYGVEDNYPKLLEKLQNDIREYDALMEKKNRYMAARNNVRTCYEKYRYFCQELHMPTEEDMSVHLVEVRDNLLRCMESQQEYISTKQKVQNFEQSHDMQLLHSISNEEETDISQLNEKLHSLQDAKDKVKDSMNAVKKQMGDTGLQLDEIAREELQLKDMQMEYETLKHRYTVLEETSRCLIAARNNFNARYLGPIKKSFEYYYSLLSNGDSKEYELDANLNILLKAYGKDRNVSNMSFGYKDLIGLCRRMAIIDAMYDKEKPFIVLDDPFVNLDEDKMTGAKKFIQELSENYQIIYFTCHPSRAVL